MFDSDTAADRKARETLNRETKAAIFDDALAAAKAAPKTARELAAVTAERDALAAVADRPINVTVKPPAVPRKAIDQAKLSSLRLLSLAAYAGMKQHAEQGHIQQHIMDIMGDKKTHQFAIRDATNVATTTSAGWGAELVSSMTMGFINELVQTSVAAQLMARIGTTPFNGANSLTWPMRADAGKGSMKPAWVSDGSSIPVLETTLASVTLSRHKMAGIATASDELVATSNPGILALIESFIRDDASIGLDDTMFDPLNVGIVATRPASITNGANTTTSDGGSTVSTIMKDIKWLRAEMSAVGAIDPVILIHSDRYMGLQMAQGTTNDSFPLRDELAKTNALFGVPIMHSPHMHPSRAIIVDAARMVIAMDGVSVDTSTAATLVMINADGVAPTMSAAGNADAVDEAGSIHISDAAGTTPQSQVRSMFQTSSTAIRFIMPLTWRMLKPSVSYLTNVLW